MQKTDSVVNLTKSSLYGIYNSSSSNINAENEEVEEYLDGAKLHIKAEDSHPVPKKTTKPRRATQPSHATQATKVVFRMVAVIAAAQLYNEVTRNIHTTHVDVDGAQINAYLESFMQSMKPSSSSLVPKGMDFGAVDTIMALLMEGLALSSVLPFLDTFMPKWCTRRVMSSNPDPYHRGNLQTDIMRSLIAFLGISYAIRNIQWKLSLQMALTWTLINPGLWMILDGTVSGFIASLGVAIGCSLAIYGQHDVSFSADFESTFTIFLFIASFFFCGVIIFGKLGRILFGQRERLE